MKKISLIDEDFMDFPIGEFPYDKNHFFAVGYWNGSWLAIEKAVTAEYIPPTSASFSSANLIVSR